MRTLLLTLSLLTGYASAQPGPVIRRITIPYIAQAERMEVTFAPGELVFDEADPALVYIGDGHTPGGVLVTPSIAPWNHIATKDIDLQGNKLLLDNIFTLGTPGGKFALNAGGLTIIGIDSGNVFGSIANLALIGGQYQLTVNVGAIETLPIIQHSFDLLTGVWTESPIHTMGEIIDGKRIILINEFLDEADDPVPLVFFRMVLPTIVPEIDVFGNTTITGDLTVTGTIPRADDIDDGVTAHTWGNHATAGYLTVQQHASITTVAVDANTAITPVMDGDVFVTTHEGDFTLTLNDPADPTRAIRVVIETRQDATGGRTVTWAGNLSTPGAVVPPALTSTANAIDVWTWQWTGATWRLIGVTFAQGNL